MQESEIIQFIELVQEMRKTQKDFFKTRNYSVMQNSKILEKEVDTKAAELLKKLSNPEENQPDLFGESNA
ncbi:MAG: hypothetical protein IKF66_01300 [Methanobrevibacter sp.]|nr:hypothetical protein [Methanobrevibacter sp.]